MGILKVWPKNIKTGYAIDYVKLAFEEMKEFEGTIPKDPLELFQCGESYLGQYDQDRVNVVVLWTDGRQSIYCGMPNSTHEIYMRLEDLFFQMKPLGVRVGPCRNYEGDIATFSFIGGTAHNENHYQDIKTFFFKDKKLTAHGN